MQTPQKKNDQKYEIKKITNHEIVIAVSDRTYQLTNVNLKQLNNFSFTLKLSYADASPFIDTVNFTRSKSRYEFIAEAKEQLFLSEDVLKDDVFILMKAIGRLQEDNIDKLTQEKVQYRKVYEMTDPERKQAMKILENDHIIKDHLLPDTRKYGHAGDELNKEIVYYAGTSRILNDPLSLLLGANSAAGKRSAPPASAPSRVSHNRHPTPSALTTAAVPRCSRSAETAA